jgi:hypothetical protein
VSSVCKDLSDFGRRVVRKGGCILYIEMRINDQEGRTLAFKFSSKTLIANDAIS